MECRRGRDQRKNCEEGGEERRFRPQSGGASRPESWRWLNSGTNLRTSEASSPFYRDRIRSTCKNRRISRMVVETITPPLSTISRTGNPM